MKTIQINVRQIGCEGFISDSSIKILIDGEEVANETSRIVWNALEVHPFEKYDYNYYGGSLELKIKAPNTNIKKFEVALPWRCVVEEWNEEEIKEYFTDIKEFIEEIEGWVKENSKCSREFSFEISKGGFFNSLLKILK